MTPVILWSPLTLVGAYGGALGAIDYIDGSHARGVLMVTVGLLFLIVGRLTA